MGERTLRAVILTETIRHPIGLKSCSVGLQGGELEALKPMHPLLRAMGDHVRPRSVGDGLSEMSVRTLVLGVVLLAANIVAAHAEDRKCIREMYKMLGDMAMAKRQCDPKNHVTNPNEYGWVCYLDRGGLVREKGHGAKQQKDALCE